MKQRITILLFILLCKFSAFAQVPSYVPTNGLVGWWPFNGNANDESGNGNNGTVNGATLTSDRFGNINKAYYFNGNSNEILVPHNNSLNALPITISVWFKTATPQQNKMMVNKYGCTTYNGYSFNLNNSKASAYYFSSGNQNIGLNLDQLSSNNQNLNDFQWHHGILVIKADSAKVYIDNSLVINKAITNGQLSITNTTEDLHFAKYPLGSCGGVGQNYFYDGILDDIGIWNRALSASEIQQLYTSQAPCALTNNFFATDSISACGNSITLNAQNAGATYSWSTNATTQTINANASGWYKCTVSQGATCSVTDSIYVSLPNAIPASLQTGLVGYWPFCGNANDESGNGNNGTVQNGTSLSSDRYGNSNSTYDFDGNDDQIYVNNSSSLSPNQYVTVNSWIYPRAYEDGKFILVKGSHVNLSTRSYGLLGPEANQKAQFRISNSATEIGVFSSANITLNSWTMVTGVYDGNFIKIFINGVFDSQISLNGLINQTSEPLTFGSHKYYNFSDYWYNGKIDDIGIWNRALTASEIQQLYTSQSANLATNNTSSNNANPSNLPNGISYQAIARDSLGQPLANSNVEVRFTLRDSSVTGSVVYKETHALTTNQFGLFSTAIGSGNTQSGVYSNINWMGPAKFLDVELKQGANYVLLGSQQLLAVPYANAALSAGKIKNSQVPVFADNSAALAGGLQVGDMYRTSSGALMIVY